MVNGFQKEMKQKRINKLGETNTQTCQQNKKQCKPVSENYKDYL